MTEPKNNNTVPLSRFAELHNNPELRIVAELRTAQAGTSLNFRERAELRKILSPLIDANQPLPPHAVCAPSIASRPMTDAERKQREAEIEEERIDRQRRWLEFVRPHIPNHLAHVSGSELQRLHDVLETERRELLVRERQHHNKDRARGFEHDR